MPRRPLGRVARKAARGPLAHKGRPSGERPCALGVNKERLGGRSGAAQSDKDKRDILSSVSGSKVRACLAPCYVISVKINIFFQGMLFRNYFFSRKGGGGRGGPWP